MASKSVTQTKTTVEHERTSNQKRETKLLQFKSRSTKEKSGCVQALYLAIYSLSCLVSYMILLSIIFVVLPLLVLFNFLRYIERKLVFWSRQSQALNGEDALWQQDTPWNRTIINGMVVVEGQIQRDKLCKVMLERGVNCKNEDGTLKFPRFTHSIRKGYFQYFWEKEMAFDIDQHVLEWKGDIPTSKHHLQEIISQIISEALPENISPWQMILVPTNYENCDAIVVVRMSHSIADGVSLTRFFTHQLPDKSTVDNEPKRFSMQRKLAMMVKALLVGPAILLGKLFLFSDNSILHGKQPSGLKRVAWTEGIDLDLIKSIKNKTRTTVNDVIMACMSIALREYYISKGAEIPRHFTSCVPVDVRPAGKNLEFMNRFAVVFLRLPTGVQDPVQQLFATKENMDVIKTSGEPIVLSTSMHYGVEIFPEWIVRPVVASLTCKSSCVLSNVPGPQTCLKIEGHNVKFMTFWPPQRDSIGLALSIYSYNGQVYVGVEGDVAILPDPQKIADIFINKVDELARRVDQL